MWIWPVGLTGILTDIHAFNAIYYMQTCELQTTLNIVAKQPLNILPVLVTFFPSPVTWGSFCINIVDTGDLIASMRLHKYLVTDIRGVPLPLLLNTQHPSDLPMPSTLISLHISTNIHGVPPLLLNVPVNFRICQRQHVFSSTYLFMILVYIFQSSMLSQSLLVPFAHLHQGTHVTPSQKAVVQEAELTAKCKTDEGVKEISSKVAEIDSLKQKLRRHGDYDEIKQELEIMNVSHHLELFQFKLITSTLLPQEAAQAVQALNPIE
ncbi:hypothetical protein K439DRAFT_1622255 [Ramaria rubella]|nr:hypothetical protein K439DRAFT_1622255 [Ramaria rubella]